MALTDRLQELRCDLEAEETYVYSVPAARATGAAEQLLAARRQRSETEALLTACQLSCPIVLLRGDADSTLGPEAAQPLNPPAPPQPS